jgi:DNA-binding beta-propeller fold protein YncE
MYLSGRQYDKVYQYSSNTPFALNTFSYDNKSLALRTEQYTPEDVSLSPNGDYCYTVNKDGDILQSKLSTPWDISTATKELSYYGPMYIGGDQHSLYMKKDGSSLYVADSIRVHRHRISLSPYAHPGIGSSTAESAQQYPWYGFASVGGLYFKPDGTKMYIVSALSQTSYIMRHYTLLKPWDPNGGYVLEYTYTFPIQSGESYHSVQDVFFKPDGKTLYYCENYSRYIVAHTLSTAWDLSTISSSYTTYDHGANYNTAVGLHFSPNGKYMFTLGGSRRVRRFELSTPWDITTATHNSANRSDALFSSHIDPYGIHFKYDGTVLYAIDQGTDTIYQWNLSTPWDVSNVTNSNYTDSLAVSTIDNRPAFMFISDSGTNLYFNGDQNHKLYHRTL